MVAEERRHGGVREHPPGATSPRRQRLGCHRRLCKLHRLLFLLAQPSCRFRPYFGSPVLLANYQQKTIFYKTNSIKMDGALTDTIQR
jgi:hypothetical protein